MTSSHSEGRSLADVGYATAGLDDAWQACGTGVDGSFHDKHGTPLVNTTTFPDLGGMVAKAHALGSVSKQTNTALLSVEHIKCTHWLAPGIWPPPPFHYPCTPRTPCTSVHSTTRSLYSMYVSI